MSTDSTLNTGDGMMRAATKHCYLGWIGLLGLTALGCSGETRPTPEAAAMASQAISDNASEQAREQQRAIQQQKAAAAAKEIEDQYIVVFKPGVVGQVAGTRIEDIAQKKQAMHGGRVTRQYQHALRGLAMKLSHAERESLAKDSDVKYIVPDGIVTADADQPNATWGLDRIDQRALPLNQTYTYSTEGAGVHAYIIDTGIRATHTEFGNGPNGASRVSDGYDTVDGDSDPTDCNGHGTHVAGTVGGTTYGVAKQVTLHAVRVLDCGGSGTYSGVIAGIDWVTANHVGPAVANMSLGGGFNQAVNDAVTNSIAAGVIYAIAAGNSSANACSYSPASTPNALTVGATESTD
ncbi:MAG: S8 family peptidase, partial [Myxococcales bacterium]